MSGTLIIEMHVHTKNVTHEGFLARLAERYKRTYRSPMCQYMFISSHMCNDYFYFC